MDIKCYAPWGYFLTNPTGSVIPCCFMTGDIMGNLTWQSFQDVWNGQRYIKLRRCINNGDYSSAGCGNCYLTKLKTRITFPLMELTKKDLVFENNYNKNKEEYETGKEILESKPLYISNTFSHKCNLSCVMCWERVNYDKTEMSEAILNKMKELYKYALIYVMVGGEPFFLKPVLDYMDNYKAGDYPYLQHSFTTNGTLLNYQLQEKLKKLGNVILVFSIDGATKSVYEKIRVGANYETTIENLKLAVKNGFRVNVNFVVMKSNIQEIPYFMKLIHDIGGIALSFTPITGNHIKENIFMYKKLLNGVNTKQIFEGARNVLNDYKNSLFFDINGISNQLTYMERNLS